MRIKTSILAKILAWFLIAVSGLGLVGYALLAIGMENAGFYENTYEELKEEKYSLFSERYSARVLHYLNSEKDSNQEYFADKNFNYGVIEADFWDDIEKLNLNDPKNYVESNFDFTQNLSLENMHIFQCTINENTYYSFKNPNSLWGYYYISNTSDNWDRYQAKDFVYDYASGIIFAWIGSNYYPVPKVVMSIYDNNGGFTLQGFEFDAKTCGYQLVDNLETEFGEHQYNVWLEVAVRSDTSEEGVLTFLNEIHEAVKKGGNGSMNFTRLEDTILDMNKWSDVSITTREEVYEHTEVSTEVVMDAADTDMSGNYYTEATTMGIHLSYSAIDTDTAYKNLNKEIRMQITQNGEMYAYVKPTDMKSNTYFVLSYQDQGFSYDKDLTLAGKTDVYGQFEIIYGTLYGMRYEIFGSFFSCLAAFLGAFIFLCCAAGHKKGQTELVQTWFNKIPLELYAFTVIAVEVLCILLMDEASWNIQSLGDMFWIVVVGIGILVAGLLLTASALEVVTRIKLRIFWKNTICYWVISKLFGGAKQAVGFIGEHTSLALKAVCVVGANAVVDFLIFIVLANESGLGFFLFVVKCSGVLLLALSVVAQLKKLKEAGEHMAKGDLTYRIDTKGLLWDFREHGENLNSVGEGLAIAVEERMKSEHFKTELITNVSHDIKTPLTSIINYVDLMQKEEVNNAKIEEYLEVLERQSKRLKKLLEDLLEASKASAGTLPVGLEILEAGVFMVQTVGEFEEKMAAQKLELIIKKPEEAVYINADGRHFWRVIDNLMNNICKYAQPNTRVYINLEAVKDEVSITFRNTSCYPLNITSEELMERFVRGDESRHTEGSGLGLSIAQSLMELMGGKFELVVDGDLFKVILVFKRVYENV